MPIQSMTGYGRGDASNKDVTVTVELRSVNNRFRDLQVRSPREYLALEPRITKALKAPFARGRIDAFIRRQANRSQQVVRSDPELAAQYLEAIRSIVGDSGLDIPLSVVLSQPGVITVDEGDVDVSVEWDIVETAVSVAITDLEQMRIREGEALVEDLLKHLSELMRGTAEVEAVSGGINRRILARIEGRMRRLIGDRVDPDRLVQEAAVLADKADVSEELARLRSHCEQFGAALSGSDDGPIGRRLDFLLQEMHREVNTIGSKAAEHPISHRVVEMKSTLERMREQSANVE
jgi:uncharacterized protein (TIGR00255 family)